MDSVALRMINAETGYSVAAQLLDLIVGGLAAKSN
jgi:hypothetical protein